MNRFVNVTYDGVLYDLNGIPRQHLIVYGFSSEDHHRWNLIKRKALEYLFTKHSSVQLETFAMFPTETYLFNIVQFYLSVESLRSSLKHSKVIVHKRYGVYTAKDNRLEEIPFIETTQEELHKVAAIKLPYLYHYAAFLPPYSDYTDKEYRKMINSYRRLYRANDTL